MEKVVIRPAKISDLDELVKVEKSAWPEEQAFTREHFESHLEVMKDFPRGIQVAVVSQGIVGIGIAEIIQYDIDNPIPDWYTVTDEGNLRNSFNPQGNVLYGVSLSVIPGYSTMRIGKSIIEAAKVVTRDFGLERFVLGSRIPRFHKFASRMTVEEYVFGRKGQRYIDPEIEFYHNCGLEVKKILPNYFEDAPSLNYGVLVVWENRL